MYSQTSNISRSSVGKKLLRLSNYMLIPDLTPGINGLDKDNCKTMRETFKLGDFVRLILEIWR